MRLGACVPLIQTLRCRDANWPRLSCRWRSAMYAWRRPHCRTRWLKWRTSVTVSGKTKRISIRHWCRSQSVQLHFFVVFPWLIFSPVLRSWRTFFAFFWPRVKHCISYHTLATVSRRFKSNQINFISDKVVHKHTHTNTHSAEFQLSCTEYRECCDNRRKKSPPATGMGVKRTDIYCRIICDFRPNSPFISETVYALGP